MKKTGASPKKDDPKQSQRFVETAKELESEEDDNKFEKAFQEITTDKVRPK